MKSKLGIYVHVPFCVRKCLYCDFCSDTNLDSELVAKYFRALNEEINLYRHMAGDYVTDSIFIGGGTPSAVDSRYIDELMNHLNKWFEIDRNCEITIEANPGTIDIPKARDYIYSGLNRMSVGVQTLNDQLLKKIGRIHNAEEAEKTLSDIHQAGFLNVSVDLMFNLPDQRLKDVTADIDKILKHDINHISYYSLKVEENTPFHKMLKNNQIQLGSDEQEREIYHRIIEMLGNRGFKQYEISNFSMPGYESRHNMKYWSRESYLGLGLSSHSFIGQERFSNTTNLHEYIHNLLDQRLSRSEGEIIQGKDIIWEYLILGLRKTKGIQVEAFRIIAGSHYHEYRKILNKLEMNGLIEFDATCFRLTSLGMDLSNTVFVELLI
ncbi:MAG: radical SAM family heme chaperone HemW [Eubacteriales bacterium]|nr:radical SAM family heme chaperone HemW [Eubacteriales bacterium]